MKLETAQAAHKACEKARELAITANKDYELQALLTETQIRRRLTLVRSARRHLNAIDRDLQALLKGSK